MGAVLCCCGRRDRDEEVEESSLLASTTEASPPLERDAPFPGCEKTITKNEYLREYGMYGDGDEDDYDGCHTCLEEYTHDNPKIVAKCGHHYHLPCIFAWQERSDLCPACSRVLEFELL